MKHFLVARDKTTSEWVESAIANAGPGGLFSVGGFSMVCGVLRPKSSQDSQSTEIIYQERLERLAVLTNRSTSLSSGTSWIFAPEEFVNPTIQEKENCSDTYSFVREHTYGISNSLYTEPWPKVYRGCDLLSSMIAEDIASGGMKIQSQDALIQSLFDILSVDELPREALQTGDPVAVFDALRHSIKVPVFSAVDGVLKEDYDSLSPVPTEESIQNAADGNVIVQHVKSQFETNTSDKPYEFKKGMYYGTRTQTLILVDNYGNVTYVERDLNDVTKKEPVLHEFKIDGWSE